MQMQTNGLTYEVFHVVRKKVMNFGSAPLSPHKIRKVVFD